MTEEEVLLVKPPEDGQEYFSFHVKDGLLATRGEKPYDGFNAKSFHLDNYCFDSNPEKDFFWNVLHDRDVDKVWFTGMLTHGQTEFFVSYIDPESNTLRNYYPDFLVQKKDGSYVIVEVKGENKIDTPVVLAKAAYARQVAVASGMDYRLIPSLQAKLGLQTGVDQMRLLDRIRDVVEPEILHEVGEALRYREYLPLYTLAAACGRFGEERLVEDPTDWVRISGRMTRNENLYVVRAVGHSMEPRIRDGEYCVFEYRQNEVPEDNAIVLAEHADVIDGETRGAYSIKKLVHEGGKVIFRPLNPDYDDIELDPTRGYRIVGVLRTNCQVVADNLKAAGS